MMNATRTRYDMSIDRPMYPSMHSKKSQSTTEPTYTHSYEHDRERTREEGEREL
jgi:hypothetical protein